MMYRVLTIAKVVWLEMLRRKDFYVLLILLGTLLFYLMSLNIFGVGGAARYIKDIGLLMTWVCTWILTINLASRQLPTEEKERDHLPLTCKTDHTLGTNTWEMVWNLGCCDHSHVFFLFG